MSSTRASAPPLRATTVALPEPPDLLAVSGADGRLFRTEDGGLVGRGEVLRLDLPSGVADAEAVERVGEILASIETDDPLQVPGTGPVAIGALPFDPAEAGHLVVPRQLFGRRGGSGWLTTVEVAGDARQAQPPEAPAARAGRHADPPDRFHLASTMSHSEWCAVVSDTLDVLGRGELDKVVLARRIDIEANRPFVVADVLERLIALYPSCMIFSMAGFLGASPELLIRREGSLVESHPLAGTVARSGDAHGDEVLVAGLMGSSKIRHEHRVVVEAIATTLRSVCDELTVPDEPSVLGLRNVSHLATRIAGVLSAGAPSALGLVSRVHPTPAVGGSPTEAAIPYLQKVEGFDRGRYAGPVGWVDSRGDGCWAVGIRSAEVHGAEARIFAGNGIVAGSDPRAELAETQLKLQALLAALVRP